MKFILRFKKIFNKRKDLKLRKISIKLRRKFIKIQNKF